jgi:predicted glycosyltransferase
MAKGWKTGGRTAGTPNKRGKEARDLFAKLGGPDGRDYAAQLHTLATAPHDDPHVRIKALAIIAPYLWGKPTERLEVTGADGGPVQINHNYAA